MRVLGLAIAAVALATGASAPVVREVRMTPTEAMSSDNGSSQVGSSKLAEVHPDWERGTPRIRFRGAASRPHMLANWRSTAL